MSFWASRTGEKVDGSDENSFSAITYNFKPIPDNTIATAMVQSALLNEFQGEKYYTIIWMLTDGEYKDISVKQNIKVYSSDDKKAQLALNMFMRLFKLADVKLTHANEPSNHDMLPLNGKKMCVKIGNNMIEERNTTWVREIYEQGKFVTQTGYTAVNTVHSDNRKEHHQEDLFNDSAMSRNKNTPDISGVDDDIPF